MPSKASADESPLASGNRVWSSVHFTKSEQGDTIVKHHAWDNDSLAPYRRFPVLFGERKYASKFPEKPLGASFEDLPGEVRNKIYDMVMIQEPAYIELAPKTNRDGVGNYKARHHHIRRLTKQTKSALHLMRVNKQIGAEAASVYYGLNEFRFTNVKGWYVLDTFLREIGPANVARLRSIAVHVPWHGYTDDHYGDGLRESKTQLGITQTMIRRMGMHPRYYLNSFNQVSCIKRVAKVLESVGKLQSFRLVLPDSYFLYEDWDLCIPINAENFPKGLKISLVSLQGGYKTTDEPDNIWGSDPIFRRGNAIGRGTLNAQHDLSLKLLCKNNGWKIECLAHDVNGYYPSAHPDDKILQDWNEGFEFLDW